MNNLIMLLKASKRIYPAYDHDKGNRYRYPTKQNPFPSGPGYPPEISDLQYNPEFSVRGLWWDNLHGNMLKGMGRNDVIEHSKQYQCGT